MKASYKNRIPKTLIIGMVAATACFLAGLIVFGICGIWGKGGLRSMPA